MNAEFSVSPLSYLLDRRVGSSQAARRVATQQAEQAARREGQAQSLGADPAQELERSRRALEHLDRRLSFRVDEESGRTVISIVDVRTSQVLKQIPAEEMLAIARQIESVLREQQNAQGVLVADSA